MKRQNKIFQIVPYYPPHLGGMEKCVKIISEILSKDFLVTVITSNIGAGNDQDVESKVKVIRTKSIELANTAMSFSLFVELLKISKNSIVHLHVANAFYPELVYVFSKIKRFKYISHIHIDVKSSGKFGFLLPYYKKFILKYVLRNAEKIICLTGSSKSVISQQYQINQNKIIIIPNGVHDQFFVKEREFTKSKCTALFVGRLSKQKNLEILIKSFKYLNRNYSLSIVGAGIEEKNLRKLIKDLNIKNVTLFGEKSGKELIKFYKESDIFILPSNNEGMSLAMLEAMAAGLPIIANNISQVKEIIGGGGAYVNENNPESFSTEIENIFSDIKRRSLMSKINIKSASAYKWGKIVDRIKREVYSEIS